MIPAHLVQSEQRYQALIANFYKDCVASITANRRPWMSIKLSKKE
jgi:hypothetical protein